MIGHLFTDYIPEEQRPEKQFEDLLNLFNQIMMHTSGDVDEALEWMRQLDERYNFTSEDYTLDDFIEDLKEKGYITDDGDPNGQGGGYAMTAKSEQTIRQQSLEEIFGKMRKSGKGNHNTPNPGMGDEPTTDRREFQFGDTPENIAMTDSIRNAQVNNGIGDFMLTENDLEVNEKQAKAQMSTVLMIDISHSMILYGEDRITPAKKTAMALAEMITQKYPKDTLDIIVFGNDAWQVQIKDLPYLQVGPYHTNTIAGLELAMDLLRRKKNANKQIFMITDGKPTCMKVGMKYYQNPFGLDKQILNKTLNLSSQCRRQNILINTFMVASDPFLQQFVKEFTEANNGKAFYTSLDGLGEYIFEDYERNRNKRVR